MSAEREECGSEPLKPHTKRFSVTQKFGTAVPRQGLSPAGLRAFVAQYAGSICKPSAEELANAAAPAPVALPFEQLTTFEVVARVIKVATLKTAGSYTEMLLQQDARDEAGIPLAGRATVFVSHAWAYPFADLVAALETRFGAPDGEDGSASTPASTPYLWLDIFVGSQHKSDTLPQEWWSNAFATAIRDLGHTCLVLQPWHAPLPLTRSWCLWEIFSTLSADVRFEVLIPPGQEAEFQEALERRFDDIAAAMSRIDTRCADAFKSDDKIMIDAAVNASKGGFYEVNSRILAKMREWLVGQSRALVAARRNQHGMEDPLTLTAMSNLARMLCLHGQLDEAVALYTEVVRARTVALAGSTAVATAADGTPGTPRSNVRSTREALLAARSALASARGARGELHVAIQLHRRVKRDRYAAVEDSCTDDDAVLVESQLEYARAMVAFCAQPARHWGEDRSPPLLLTWPAPFRLSRWFTVKVAKPLKAKPYWGKPLLFLVIYNVFFLPLVTLKLTVLLLNVLDNVAVAVRSLGYLRVAERRCRDSLAILQRTQGMDAPATLECSKLLAVALRDQGRLNEAAPLLRAAADGLLAKLGPNHVQTCSAQAELADLLREQGDVAAAEELFVSLAGRLAEQVGDSHPEALAARINVALCVACRGELDAAAELLDASKSGFVSDAAAMDGSAPGRLQHAGTRTLRYVRGELVLKSNEACDPETCENQQLCSFLCAAAGLVPKERKERLGLIFRRVMLRHTRVWRRRRMLVVWSATSAVVILFFLAYAYFLTKLPSGASTVSPPPPPVAIAGRRLLGGL